MFHFPDEILTRYGLSEEAAMEAARYAISLTLTNHFGVPVLASTSNGFSMVALHGNYESEVKPAQIKQKLRRLIEENVEYELQRRQAAKEQRYLRQLIGKPIYGGVIGICEQGTLLIKMELTEVFNQVVLMGECPVKYQIPRERQTYSVGDVLSFKVTSVAAVANDKSARVRILLSRVSPELPALLLREQSGIDKIICIRRLPGKESWIKTAHKIPKPIINAVGKELREHLNVRIIS